MRGSSLLRVTPPILLRPSSVTPTPVKPMNIKVPAFAGMTEVGGVGSVEPVAGSAAEIVTQSIATNPNRHPGERRDPDVSRLAVLSEYLTRLMV